MAGDYIFSDDVVRVPEAVPSRIGKILKWMILIISLILGAELIWLFGVTPFMPFSRIDISGGPLGREAVFAEGGITPQSSFVSLNVRKTEKAFRNLPGIEKARVFKRFPDRLEIILEGRKAAAFSLANLSGVLVPVFYDKEGVVFQLGFDETLQAESFPVISGLVIEQPFLGMRLPAMFNSFLESLEEIELSAPELLAAVSEIQINRKLFDGFDLTLYPVHNRISVRLSELNEELLRYTLLIVDALAAENSGIETIDFRSGIASYTVKAGRERSFKEALSE
ncbi:MAG: FtsQ-type POTRA domain-containing protein [Treponema sp.]|jgi:cell division protein FtsQ|nr:FtsQ-type POTRA domain-containing protein [Treponema sp.]